MFLNNIKLLCMLAATVFLSGCIDREITITLNSDGSGTLKYIEHFDRADDEMRAKIKKHLSSPRSSTPLDEDKLDDLLPSPNFKVISSTHDKERLHREIVVEFKDMNELLASDQAKAFNLSDFDFKVVGKKIEFSLAADPAVKKRPNQKPPKKMMAPPRMTLTVINAVTGEKVLCFREKTEKETPEWKAFLSFPKLKFNRRKITKLFKNLPVIKAGAPGITSASWSVSEGRFSRSSLNVDMTVPFTTEAGVKYLSWRDPVVLEGAYDDETPAEFTQMSKRGGKFVDQYNKETPGVFTYSMKLKRPSAPVTRLGKIVTRFTVEKAEKSETKEFAKAEKGAKFEIDGAVYEIDKISDRELSLKISKKTRRLAKVFQLTARGNKFELKQGSWSASGDTEAISFKPAAKVQGSIYSVEAYTGVETVYLDMTLDSLELTLGKSGETTAANLNWMKNLEKELSKYLNVSTPVFDDKLFENEKEYKAYFTNLKDEQVLPAILKTMLYTYGKEFKNADNWIQRFAQLQLGKRRDYLKANRQRVAGALFAFYKSTPKPHPALKYVFSNNKLLAEVRNKALEEVKQGNVRFASEAFITKPLSSEEKGYVRAAMDKVTDDKIARSEAFKLLLSDDKEGIELAERSILDPTVDMFMAGAALDCLRNSKLVDKNALAVKLLKSNSSSAMMWALEHTIKNGSVLPIEGYKALLLRYESASDALNVFKRLSVQKHKAQLISLKPLLPLLEDISESQDSWTANKAKAVVKNIKSVTK